MEIRGKKETEHIILKYDKQIGKYLDKTKEIFYLKDEGNSWYVRFCNNEKPYHIKKVEIRVSVHPVPIDIDINSVYVNHRKISDVMYIIKFDNLGYKVFLKNDKTFFVEKIVINNRRVDIDFIDYNVKKSGNKILDYYKLLAKYAADITMDDTSIEHLLYNLYKKIENVNPNSVLNVYTQCMIKKIPFDKKSLIYPFATNFSQMTAIRKTFENELSVISGPPGTGKTQVILNIISNAVIHQKSVAVISNNNTAVENVYDKMKEEGLDFFLANLGKGDNVNNFFSNTDNIDEKIKALNIKDSNDQVDDITLKLENLYEISNQLTQYKHDWFELEEEYRHYQETHEYKDCSTYLGEYKDYNKYLDLKYYLLSIKKIGFFQKMKLTLKYNLKNTKIISLNDFIVYLEYKFFVSKIKNIRKKVKQYEKYIDENNVHQLTQELKHKSMNKLCNYLLSKYSHMEKYIFNKDNYKNNFKKFIDRYPVILSTTQSLLRNIEYGFQFDLVIIDEASQSDILTSLLNMNAAKQMVIVGDIKQLSQIDNQKIYNASDILIEQLKVEKTYQYKDNSILQSVLSLSCGIENTILREHYRCDSRIIGFCNKKFYENELIICTKTSHIDPLFIVHTVAGNHARRDPSGRGYYNNREIMEIIEILKKRESKDIGIITPFNAQVERIKELISDDFPYVEVDTIHKYQGRQKKIIILSTVVNDLSIEKGSFITDFVTDSQLLNVAISRAVEKLYLVVSDKVYNSNKNTIAQFIHYIKYYCRETNIEEGKVTSIFDILYNEQNRALYNSPCYKYVDSYAEAIMKDVLDSLLVNYPDYKLKMHYRLSDLIQSYDGFNAEEIRYIQHPKTHVDFVIFDRISYSPIVCIEVDGTRYHDYSIRQIEHDRIKTKVLENNQIRILRLKTNQSGEIEKIKAYL